MIGEQDKAVFSRLCEEESARKRESLGSIGTYAEKRLHYILKRWVVDDARFFEIPVGRYVADVVRDTEITEIQTGSLRPLLPKLRYYLEQTDCSVTVLYPVMERKTLLRMDKDSGELLYKKRSPKRGSAYDALCELFWLSELLPSSRLTVKVLLIEGDEYRFSERMRYRKQGAYDAELYPRALNAGLLLRDREDFRCFLPTDAQGFTAEEYAKQARLRGRKLYSALNLLCSLGLLRREREGRRYRYWIEP